MVSSWKSFIPTLINDLNQLCPSAKAGRISKFFSAWTDLTSDKEILSDVGGMTIELADTPTQHQVQTHFDSTETKHIESEISKMLKKAIIERAKHESGEIVSNIFSIPKKDGSHPVILNLKDFNTNVSYHHFKIDSLNTILKLIDKDCFMASIDLKDAYYSIAIRNNDHKYLRFCWNDNLFQFTCLRNGLSSCPWKFTKILKPVLSSLHANGHIVLGHLDDFNLQGKTYKDCCANLIDTVSLFTQLGLLVHPEKCALIPSQEIIMLGFIINSRTMTVKLPPEKALALKSSCDMFIKKCHTRHTHFVIREVAQIVGKLVSSFPAVLQGPLYYRNLERDKTSALACNNGNFDAKITISAQGISELQWWATNVRNAFKPTSHSQPSLVITTDASLQGWGGGMPECDYWGFMVSC